MGQISKRARRPTEQSVSKFPKKQKVDGRVSIVTDAGKIKKPQTYQEAVNDPVNGRRWRDAIDAELATLQQRGTWRYESLPRGRKPITSKWVFTVKTDEDGNFDRFKARLVARGYLQVYGVDFFETYSPTVRRESLRIFLSLVAFFDMELHQMDVKGAYLEGDLNEDKDEEPIYMQVPEGVRIPSDKGGLNIVCLLVKTLYGLKQSGRVWNRKFVSFLKSIGFIPLNGDPSVLVKYKQGGDGKSEIIMSVYVDDLLIAAKTLEEVKNIKDALCKKFTMTDMGEARSVIGWRILRNREERSLTIDQAAFIKALLEKYGMQDCNSSPIPMLPGNHIPLDEEGDTEITDMKKYQVINGELNYVSCGTRPDISYATGQLSQHMMDPRAGHMKAAWKVLRYLRGTLLLCIKYGGVPKAQLGDMLANERLLYAMLRGYADASYAGDPQDRKSIMGYCFMLNGGIVTWSSRKQRTVSNSTTEAEYIATSYAAKEAVWIRRYVNELKLDEPLRSVNLKGDNMTGVTLTKNPGSQNRTKHIDVQHHFVRELVEEGELSIDWIPTRDMLADALTKALPGPRFRELRERMGMVMGRPLRGRVME